MRVTIEVDNRREGETIKRALEDKTTRAFVLMVGHLKPLSPRARARVLTYVADAVSDPDLTSVDVDAIVDRPVDDGTVERTDVERGAQQ